VKTRFSTLSAFHLAVVLGAAPLGAAELPAAAPPFTPRAQSIACGPRTLTPPAAAPRVLGGRDRATKGMFAPGEVIVLDTSDRASVAAGQLYVVYRTPRSAMSDGDNAWVQRAAQNAGIVRVERVMGQTASATIVWACDGVEIGDRLEPYAEPAAAPEVPSAAGAARFDQASEVLFGGQDRRLGAARDFLLVARAQGLDVAPGQRVTFFRRPFGVDGPITLVGEGVVQGVAVATFLVEVASSRDAVTAGDLAATHAPGKP
jgi:hypothetical protein